MSEGELAGEEESYRVWFYFIMIMRYPRPFVEYQMVLGVLSMMAKRRCQDASRLICHTKGAALPVDSDTALYP